MKEPIIDHTHDELAASWVSSANHPDVEFPIQNLPFATINIEGNSSLAVGIGDELLLLRPSASGCPPFSTLPEHVLAAVSHTDASRLMRLEREDRVRLRSAIFDALHFGADRITRESVSHFLMPGNKAAFSLPTPIPNYTDFFASIHHATRVGKLFRPDAPLLPNYKHIPIAYHGRASSVRVSGERVIRPTGQIKPVDGVVHFSASRRLDYEMEMGFWISRGSELGCPLKISDADDLFFGCSLLNDWSARDIQTWEYQPLGPFLSKSFLTTISPWIVTAEALAPFRSPASKRDEDDPEPLPYLSCSVDQQYGAIDIELRALMSTRESRRTRTADMLMGHANTRLLYWTIAQMIAHHTSNGCPLEPGDLLGSGTVSGPGSDEGGSLLELSNGGSAPISLPNGEKRTFLEDGDEVSLMGLCARSGYRSIGFGRAVGRVSSTHGD